MSRSYAILAASLTGVVGLAAIARVIPSDPADELAGEVAVAATVPVTTSPPTTAVVVDADCVLSQPLRLGVVHEEVVCLESRLVAAGVLDVTPDDVFDASTDAAVRTVEARNGLLDDGVVGPATARAIGTWVGPDALPPDPSTCPSAGRAAVVDRDRQRTWLCDDGDVVDVIPMTSAITQPDPGTYRVYAKDLNASSTLTGEYSTMTHFVAFTYGEYQGARIAFHSVPRYADGGFVQPLDSVGTEALFGESSGCIRLLPDDAERMWAWLDVGDTVTVVT
jgi:peptidoglycan hydrolase-like protein with peptidoglycan-binding domain